MEASKKRKGICHIAGAGEDYGLTFTPSPEDFVIAADAGFTLLKEKGIAINLVIGDFDTLRCQPLHPNVITLSPEKNDTDMRAAVREGLRAGYQVFHIYGGTGGRIDHTLANLQLLAELSQNGCRGFLFHKDCVITAITDDSMHFSKRYSGYLSVLSHSAKSEGVYLKGLKYELENAVLENTYPLGVSNEFTGKESLVSVRKGTLLLVYPFLSHSKTPPSAAGHEI